MRYSIIGATIDDIRAVGGSDIRGTSIGIIFATLTEEQADKLISMGFHVSEVKGVSIPLVSPPTPITPITAGPVYTPQDLLSYANLEKLRDITDPPLYGENMNLAIIDTGIRETHEGIAGRVVYSKNYTSDPMGDGFDHGTGVCSIALAVAPQCNILNLKVLDSKGEGSEEEAVLAIDDCIIFWDTQPEIAPIVINLSFGSPDDGDPNDVLRIACRAAIAKGILIVAAAGNSGPTSGTIMSPACERYVGAVGSCRPEAPSSLVVSNFSSRGPTLEGLIKPDAVLFGESIEMASSASDSATTTKSGTSFAAPFGSGIILLFQEGIIRHVTYPEGIPEGFDPTVTRLFTAQELMDVWTPRISAKPQGVAAGKDDSYGWGLPAGDLILKALQPTPTIDFSSLLEIVGIVGMMGIVMAGTTKMIR